MYLFSAPYTHRGVQHTNLREILAPEEASSGVNKQTDTCCQEELSDRRGYNRRCKYVCECMTDFY